MSVAVALEALAAKVAEFGDHPYLITVGSDGRAHVVSVAARLDGAQVAVAAGRTSRANAEARPAVTLLWPAAASGPYSLIVDGESSLSDRESTELTIRPTRVVLHRVAGASPDLPSCIPLEDAG